MKKSKIIWLSVIAGIAILTGVLASNIIGFGNTENELRAGFEQKIDERTAFYDKMWKVLSDKSKITLKMDTSFHKMINTIMSNRKDGEGVFMKWITESNPGVTFDKVADMYQSLSRTLEAEREGFFVQEKVLQDIVKQHKILITNFPGKLYNMFYDKEILVYKPITSTRTDDVMKTGKDDKSMIF